MSKGPEGASLTRVKRRPAERTNSGRQRAGRWRAGRRRRRASEIPIQPTCAQPGARPRDVGRRRRRAHLTSGSRRGRRGRWPGASQAPALSETPRALPAREALRAAGTLHQVARVHLSLLPLPLSSSLPSSLKSDPGQLELIVTQTGYPMGLSHSPPLSPSCTLSPSLHGPLAALAT